MAEPVIQNALQLRHLAEQASGMRGLYWNVFAHEEGDGLPFVSIKPPEPDFDAAKPMMEWYTRYQNPHRPSVDVWIRGEGREELLDKYDAVFWSESAVEKFVFPYYASKMLWMAPHFLTVLARFWYGFLPGVEPAPERPVILLEGEEVVPYAIAHLPTSDYILLPENLGEELHIFFRSNRDGETLRRSLAELVRIDGGGENQNG